MSFNPAGTDIVLVLGFVDDVELDGGTEIWRLDSLRCSLFGGWLLDPPPLRVGRAVCLSMCWFGRSILFGRLRFWRDLSLWRVEAISRIY